MKTTIIGLLLFCCSFSLFGQSNYHPTQMLVYFTSQSSYSTFSEQEQLANDNNMEVVWVSPLSNIHLWRMIGSQNGGIPGDINEKVVEVDDPNSGVNGFLDYETWVPNGDNGPDWVNGDPSGPCDGQISTVLPYAYLEAGLRVAILDTGVGGDASNDATQSFTFKHPTLFANRTNAGLGWDLVNDSPYPSDDHGHGTHVSGIIAMILNSANVETDLIHYKTHNADGMGYVSNLVYAIDKAAIANAQIINMSCSYQSLPTIAMAPLQKAIETAGAHNGALIVTSSGNDEIDIDNAEHPNYPAAFVSENILTVGSIRCDLNPSEFSNWGPVSVDIAAPGEEIVGPSFVSPGFISKSGTSQATAIVSGAAAQIALRQNDVHYDGIKCAILVGVQYIGLTAEFGTGGMINANQAAQIADDMCAFNLQSSPPQLTAANHEHSLNTIERTESLIEKWHNTRQIQIAPNPASQDFILQISESIVEESELQINMVAADGRSYPLRQEIINENSLRLTPLQDMPSGLYFIYLTHAKNHYPLKLIWQAR